jgi:SAM-dependent methyltransferase
MDKKTAKILNQINKEFYLKTQEYFNKSRQFYWAGWEKLLPYLHQARSLKVLDVGCGNGRLGKFLIARGRKIEYVGIDNNKYLLKMAKKALPKARLIKQDILKPWPVDEKQDLVAIMGVMHHLALDQDREKVLKWAYEIIKPGGVVFVSFWLFNLSKQFKRLKSDWSKVNIDKNKLGKNDYLLSWSAGVKTNRYCHLYNTQEINKLVKSAKLQIVDDYLEDTSNRYVILKPED